MSEHSKLSVSHLRRQAFVYVRQSTQAQLERNQESTERQYALVERALELGFAREQVRPSYRIFYADIETAECDDHHHLTISAVGFGKPFTCAWKPEGELDVRTFNRGPWEELFFS